MKCYRCLFLQLMSNSVNKLACLFHFLLFLFSNVSRAFVVVISSDQPDCQLFLLHQYLRNIEQQFPSYSYPLALCFIMEFIIFLFNNYLERFNLIQQLKGFAELWFESFISVRLWRHFITRTNYKRSQVTGQAILLVEISSLKLCCNGDPRCDFIAITWPQLFWDYLLGFI